MDNKVDDGVQDVENFPDNAARWTGDKVGSLNHFAIGWLGG